MIEKISLNTKLLHLKPLLQELVDSKVKIKRTLMSTGMGLTLALSGKTPALGSVYRYGNVKYIKTL